MKIKRKENSEEIMVQLALATSSSHICFIQLQSLNTGVKPSANNTKRNYLNLNSFWIIAPCNITMKSLTLCNLKVYVIMWISAGEEIKYTCIF